MALADVDDSGALSRHAATESGELELLAKDLLINVTSFFRDPKAFELLAEKVIPDLVRRHPADRPLRIWVAGCSTGEETYSLAMLFLEEIAAAKRNIKLQVFASDVDEDAVAFAREGRYPQSIAADVSPARLARFFTEEEHGYRVVSELRGVVVFTVQDVLADPPFSRLDLISCRNLLIYLRPEAQEKVLLLFHFALGEGGVLMLGGSETVGSLDGRFEPISKAQRIYRQIGRSRPGEVDFPVGAGGRARAIWPGAPHPANRAGHHPWRSHAAPADRELCAGVGSDQPQARVPLLLGSDGPLFAGGGGRAQPRPARHGARGPAQQAQCGDPASEPGARACDRHRRAGELRRRRRGPHRGPAGASEGEELLLVSFLDEPEREQRSDRPAEPADDLSRVAELERELDATRKELQSAIRDLEISNEEQKAINEEAMSVNEEFQSTNEELMTSREELQSLNEELTALNSQLQETLERQRSTSNDLQNILDSSGVATLFLDSDSQHPLLHAGGQIAVPGHRQRHRPAARRSHAARRRPRSPRRCRRRACQSRAAGARDRSRGRRLVHPPHPALPHPGQPDRGGGHHLRRHLRDKGGRARDPGGARLFRQHHRYGPPAAGRARRGVAGRLRQPLLLPDISRSQPEETVGRLLALAGDWPPGNSGAARLPRSGPRRARSSRGLRDRDRAPAARAAAPAAQCAGDPRRAARGTQDPAGDRRHHRAQAGDRGAGGRQARGRAGQSRQVAVSCRRQPRSAPAAADDQPAARDVGEEGQGRRHLAAGRQARRDRERDVGHAGHAPRHQPARGRDRPPRDGRFPDQCGARAAAHPVRLSCGGASPRMARRPEPPQRAQRSPAARADDPQPALERGQIHQHGEVLLGCRRRGNKLRIEVWDTGIGIPEEQLQAIFEEFHQLDNPARERSKGLGLGLAIVQRLADLLGHAVDVRSRPGKGSVFAVEVPLGHTRRTGGLGTLPRQRKASIAAAPS